MWITGFILWKPHFAATKTADILEYVTLHMFAVLWTETNFTFFYKSVRHVHYGLQVLSQNFVELLL